MKKVLFMLVLVGLVASSCANYTCPTYSKAKPVAPKAHRI
jgi:hypothetical protein